MYELKNLREKISVIALFLSFLTAPFAADTVEDGSPHDDTRINFSGLKPVFAIYLNVGDSFTWNVSAKSLRNWLNLGVGVHANERYRFTVGSPAWNNGVRETTAAGYTENSPLSPRFSKYKWMALVGELYWDDEKPGTLLQGTEFLIGSGRNSWSPFKSGYLVVFANDCWTCYGDNSRVVTLTIKRIE